MHILELPSFFPPHGGQFCLEQAKALKAMGHEVRIVSVVELSLTKDRQFYLTAPWQEERMEMEGVEVFRLYMRAVPKAVRRNIGRWTELCKKAVERYVRLYGKPDVLHAHCCKNAGMAAWDISRRLDIPFFITEHLSSGLFERDFGKGWQRHVWLKEEMRRTYEAATCVIPVSSELVDDLAPFFGKAYRYQVISNIVDTDFFCPSLTSDPSPVGEGSGLLVSPLSHGRGAGGEAVFFASRWPRETPRIMRQTYSACIDNADHLVQIVNPYAMLFGEVRAAIRRALERGVRVQFMVSTKSDGKANDDVIGLEMRKLMKRGAEVYYYNNGFHHSKVMMVDSLFCTVGTTNLDARSLSFDYEVNAFIFSPAKTHELQRIFQDDIDRHCTLLTPEVFKERFPLRRRMRSRFFTIAKRFM